MSQEGHQFQGHLDRSMSVARVRETLSAASFEQLPDLIEQFSDDPRAGVVSSVSSARRRLARLEKERQRVEHMYQKMHELGGNGVVLGVDEVGRGSVAGPLTVCAVALPASPILWGIDDSKRLSPAHREELAAQISQVALAIGFAHVPPQDIDACGMASSLRVAMVRAIADSGVEPDAVLIDGLPVHVHPREISVVHGDASVACIAAASIVAKVTRDALMVQADATYPGYHFAESKGYASAEHIAAIREKGLSQIHRATFCSNFLA